MEKKHSGIKVRNISGCKKDVDTFASSLKSNKGCLIIMNFNFKLTVMALYMHTHTHTHTHTHPFDLQKVPEYA